MLAEIADSMQPGLPPRENRRMQRTVDVVVGRGSLETIRVFAHGQGAYLPTGLIQAFAAHHLVHQPPRKVGFASPCEAFGHRELLAALEAYGLVRVDGRLVRGQAAADRAPDQCRGALRPAARRRIAGEGAGVPRPGAQRDGDPKVSVRVDQAESLRAFEDRP